jgi:hypothetical protein
MQQLTGLRGPGERGTFKVVMSVTVFANCERCIRRASGRALSIRSCESLGTLHRSARVVMELPNNWSAMRVVVSHG